MDDVLDDLMRNALAMDDTGAGAFVTTSNGVRLRYRDEGPREAPAIVFSNSLGTDLRMWEPQARTLAGSFRVVRYDTRGHGRSDAPPDPYMLDQLGGDLLALLDALGIARVRVCGLSLGGMTALWLAAHHPDRVTHAAFANTAARIGSVESWKARIELVRAGGMAAVREMALPRFFSAAFRADHPDLTQRIGTMLEATPPDGYIGCCEALRDADLHAAIARIAAPSLIIGGALDESTPPAQARELHAAIPGSELLIFPDTAHLSNLEQAEAFTARLRAFFERA
ncbi:MAG TPA: 3-oxoadipate enol-lactonase [Ktedonobacterales bacterium]